MNNRENKISLEVNEIKNQFEVFLYLDESTLDVLIKDLQRLKDVGDHIHYMSDDWGGVSLSSELQNDKNGAVHHFQITKV